MTIIAGGAVKAHKIQNLLICNAKDFKRCTDIKADKPKPIFAEGLLEFRAAQ